MCTVTPQLLTTGPVILPGRDSRRHSDLFNAVSLNTLSRGTHDTDTDRKSLSACLTSSNGENVVGFTYNKDGVCLLWFIGRTGRGVALVVSVGRVPSEPGENPVILPDAAALRLSPESCGTYTLKKSPTTLINISPRCRCCMLQ